MHHDILKAILALQKLEPECEGKSIDGWTEEQRLLLELIRKCRKKSPLPRRHLKKINLAHSELSNLFLKILAADCTKKEASAFLAQLFYNNHFYSALHPLLQTAALRNDSQNSDLQGVKMLSDDQLLKIVFSVQPQKYKMLKDAPSFVRRFKSFILKTGRFKSPAFAAGMLLIIVLILSVSRRPNTVFIAYFETPSQPYFSHSFSPAASESYRSSLRSSSSAADKYRDVGIHELNAQFQVGLAGYIAKDYQSAITQFQTLENRAAPPDSTAEFFAWKQEYYFYYGMAHLGLTGGKALHRTHLHKAVKYLERSLLASESISPQASDDVCFFLGLAYALEGKKYDARRLLQHIPVASPFFNAASELTSN